MYWREASVLCSAIALKNIVFHLSTSTSLRQLLKGHPINCQRGLEDPEPSF